MPTCTSQGEGSVMVALRLRVQVHRGINRRAVLGRCWGRVRGERSRGGRSNSVLASSRQTGNMVPIGQSMIGRQDPIELLGCHSTSILLLAFLLRTLKPEKCPLLLYSLLHHKEYFYRESCHNIQGYLRIATSEILVTYSEVGDHKFKKRTDDLYNKLVEVIFTKLRLEKFLMYTHSSLIIYIAKFE